MRCIYVFETVQMAKCEYIGGPEMYISDLRRKQMFIHGIYQNISHLRPKYRLKCEAYSGWEKLYFS